MPIGDGWTWNELQWHYGAAASALSFKENQAGVFMNTDGKAAASTDLMQIRGEVKPTQSGQTPAFGVQRGLESNEVYVWGNGNKAYGKLSVHDPALFTAKNFKKSLEGKGITIEGEVKSIGWKTENRPEVTNTNELASIESKPLGELIKRLTSIRSISTASLSYALSVNDSVRKRRTRAARFMNCAATTRRARRL
jgi:D-alanyl-D-alanine carboxypeptidase/D-alanyl-D-alanine-endopeptidase (penicillin-binding protein 4)